MCVAPFYAVVLLLPLPNQLFPFRPQIQRLHSLWMDNCWRFFVNYSLEIDIIFTIQVRFVYYSVESRIRWLPTFKDGIGWLLNFSGGRERAVRIIITFPFFRKQIFDFILCRRIPLWISFKISGFNCVGITVRQSFYTALKNETLGLRDSLLIQTVCRTWQSDTILLFGVRSVDDRNRASWFFWCVNCSLAALVTPFAEIFRESKYKSSTRSFINLSSERF